MFKTLTVNFTTSRFVFQLPAAWPTASYGYTHYTGYSTQNRLAKVTSSRDWPTVLKPVLRIQIRNICHGSGSRSEPSLPLLLHTFSLTPHISSLTLTPPSHLLLPHILSLIPNLSFLTPFS